MFYGKGAGKLPTASAVLGDIIEILCGTVQKVLPGFVEKDADVIKDTEGMSRYFLRIQLGDEVDGTEVRHVAAPVFGSESKIVLPSNESPYYMAVVTGYLSSKALEGKIAEFENTVNVKCENIIKVED